MTLDMQPLVTIIVPVYNVEAYLDACLDSVRGQTYRNLEIIAVEDCSTDNSLRQLDKHLTDQRVRVVRHKQNAGLSTARNTGIDAARGDYIICVDSDDLIESDLVAACVACALENDADLVLFDFVPFRDGKEVQLVQRSGGRPPQPIPRRDPRLFMLPQFAWLKFIKAELVREHELRFPAGYYYEDAPFHWELGLHAERVFHLGDAYYHYRQRGGSITGSGGRKLFDLFAVQLLIAKALESNGHVPRAVNVLAEKIYSSIWFVSTSIDDGLLAEALVVIRGHLQVTRILRSRARPSLKTALLLTLLKLPHPIALAAIRSLRNAVAALSSSRRVTRRRSARTPQPSLA